jgi:proteic killer suppression protein
MRRSLGPELAAVLMQRLNELEAAEDLRDMQYLPAAGCHELTQNRKGQLAVDLVYPKRLVFEPDHDPLPRKPDGGLDWTRVTSIVILEIVDYH